MMSLLTIECRVFQKDMSYGLKRCSTKTWLNSAGIAREQHEKYMGEWLEKTEDKIDWLDKRVAPSEAYVKEKLDDDIKAFEDIACVGEK
ncbi:hypothetical protein F2Q69_00016727 [Brassica cretica]|uniref:Uncharacterized protein n=1 Tax=Brassica cretica TaxID=69181 RepID=A0A8S9R2X0_BRACR|nr:hypothetical protein F2Q69_00016727 [Brassica cretica]